MHITPKLIIDGKDCSRYLISAHCEQTANSSKDPGKYDLVLANVGGRFTGAFAPKSIEQRVKEELGDFKIAPKRRVFLQVVLSKQGCEGKALPIRSLNDELDRANPTISKTITICSGEIQKAECDELYCRIEGSCSEGGMTSRINPRIWPTGTPIKTIVDDLLDDFGYDGPRSDVPGSRRHILPFKNTTDDVNPYLDKAIDFDTAMYEVSCWAESIYFFDEGDEFWFCPATDFRGFSNLTGNILRGSNASNVVGYANHIDVYGGTQNDGETINERKTHNLIHAFAKAPDIEIQERGLMKAPPVVLPNADQAKCQEVADNLLEWYRQYADVPTIKVSGKAPGLLSKVAYRPWNGSIPPVTCPAAGGADMPPIMPDEEPEMWPVLGLVTRRVVDISAETGFVSTLDVTTNFLGVNRPTSDEDVMNFYSKWREAINLDPAITNKYPGVLFV
jgi:hypothetical protein